MATSTRNLTGNFAGEKASGYLYPAILAANTIGSGIVTLTKILSTNLMLEI